MNSVFRCANCAHVIKKPTAQCPECGYRRDVSSTSVTKWYVYLIDFGSDTAEATRILSGKLGKSEAEIQAIRQSLPVRVMITDKKSKAEHLVMLLTRAGAEVQVTNEPYREPQKELSDAEAFFPGETGRKKSFSWLLPFIAVIPVLLTMIPDAMNRLPEMAHRIVVRHIEDDFSSFEDVLVVVAARDIEAGTVILADDLKVQVVPREYAPPNAVAPLNVDRLIGRVLMQPVQKNQIILLESVSDNKRPS